LGPSVVAADVHGDMDASSTGELTAFVTQSRGPHDDVVLDLRDVEFFGAEGFLAFETISRASLVPTVLAVVPSCSVARLFQICNAAPTIVIANDVDAAVAAVTGQPVPGLQLVVEAPSGTQTPTCPSG
jgi:anti-anti-sigma factor